ncbi:hypothetical protein BY996DRAFT_6409652 [Phakopsora pachyrhizi]|uniref:Uncharacterized protein n=1 Tax=Phakopsora pachyrhizi TaxID=170000 RepID=A0AAV0ANE0_PHAPC|nr:hypothetical protein BY996DRAFT_6409652 [Phakopsora pachyrhizi]CAH7669795.1 hypothetical protein PPACK8108_LOCUS4441 [Phakopsora pachyrhizi]
MISAKLLDQNANNNLNQKVQILIEKVQNLEEKFLVNNNEREELILCSDKKPGGSLDNKESKQKWIEVQTALTTSSRALNLMEFEWGRLATQTKEISDYVELNGPMGVFLVNSLQSLNIGNNLEEPGEGASISLKRKVIERDDDHDEKIGEHTLADCKCKKRAF